MIREIGSEFHKMPLECGDGFTLPHPGTFVFSGRAAIEYVLKDLKNVHTVLLPSYCCESMVFPFKAAGLDVKYYQVDWDNGIKVRIEEKADIVLWCNYFGFKNDMPNIEGIIIEDITHSLLSEMPYHSQSDYLVASVRKWEPINCGGYCSVEIDGKIPPEEFLRLKTAAMEMKTEYLENPIADNKKLYLKMFDESNRWLAENYSGYIIDSWSQHYLAHIDVEKQRLIRKQNAKVLYEGLEGAVQFMFPIEQMDCPLFVPILLQNRDEVRASLIKHEIFCPVHWPRPEECRSNIYDIELSLVCDQRYGIEDMERIVSVLRSAV